MRTPTTRPITAAALPYTSDPPSPSDSPATTYTRKAHPPRPRHIPEQAATHPIHLIESMTISPLNNRQATPLGPLPTNPYTMTIMNRPKFAIAAYLAVTAQTACIPILLPPHLRPNLMIALAVYYLLTTRSQNVLIAVMILAVLTDLTTVAPLGAVTVAFALAALLIRAARPILFTELPTAHAAAAFAATVAVDLIYRTLALILPHVPPLPHSLAATLGQAAATALVAALAYRIKPKRKTTLALKADR